MHRPSLLKGITCSITLSIAKKLFPSLTTKEPAMLKKTTTYITLVCFIITLYGCSSEQEVERASLEPTENRISAVVTTDGQLYNFPYRFSTSSYATLVDTIIVGYLKDGRRVEIPLSSVWRIYLTKNDPGKSIIGGLAVIAGAAVVIFAIAAATKESCPFVYSYDGRQYVFDGEPYGGAICEGLKRTDWAQLEHLKPVDGEYRLLLTNEVDETQFTDELKLWIIDHRPECEVLLDANGKAYTVAQRIKPVRATDNRGKDQLLWLGENDLRSWESDLDTRNPNIAADLRDSIRLSFPKPEKARSAKLIVSGGTTLWGSQMLKRMIELRGEAIPVWYEEMKSLPARQMLDLWNLREELYHLLVRVRVGNQWQTRGEILGCGPFITEERVVPLDLQGVEGDSVDIMLTPAAGFWQLNSFAMDYSASMHVDVQEISAKGITGDEGEDLLEVLSATDGVNYAAPRLGQKATVVFPVPPEKTGSRRTIFAKASGYYEMHMNASGPPKTEMVNRIAMEPGFPTSFAIDEYLKWKAEVTETANAGKRGSQ